MGFFYRTIRIAENGIKPAYVFDGKPPELKAGVVRVDIFSQHITGLMACCVVVGKAIRKAGGGESGRRGGQRDRLVALHSPHSSRDCGSYIL